MSDITNNGFHAVAQKLVSYPDPQAPATNTSRKSGSGNNTLSSGMLDSQSQCR